MGRNIYLPNFYEFRPVGGLLLGTKGSDLGYLPDWAPNGRLVSSSHIVSMFGMGTLGNVTNVIRQSAGASWLSLVEFWTKGDDTIVGVSS